MSEGIKHDSEKIQVELLDPLWLFGVGRVLTYGAKKYAAWNWKKGLAITRCIGAALRHIYAFLNGEDLDPETKLPHLHHASCELMFASVLMETHPHLDDRYKPEPDFLLGDILVHVGNSTKEDIWKDRIKMTKDDNL